MRRDRPLGRVNLPPLMLRFLCVDFLRLFRGTTCRYHSFLAIDPTYYTHDGTGSHEK